MLENHLSCRLGMLRPLLWMALSGKYVEFMVEILLHAYEAVIIRCIMETAATGCSAVGFLSLN